MRFAISPRDPHLEAIVAALHEDGEPAAETCRRVGRAAEELGLRRPSYQHVRRLVRLEERRRELRAQARQVLRETVAGYAAGRVPSVVLTLERLRELRALEGIVLQEHEASERGAPTAPARRSRAPSTPRRPR